MAVITIYDRSISRGSYQLSLSEFVPFTPPSGEGKPVMIQSTNGEVEWQVGPLSCITVEIPGDDVPQPPLMSLPDPKDPTKLLSANDVLGRLMRREEGYRLLKCERA
jgi:hypothetical protein